MSHTRRRILRVAMLSLLAVAVAGAVAFWWIGRAGSSGLEGWIGRQVQSVASAYLRPKLTFDSLDYRYPRTVVLDGFRLTADDPAGPGRTLNVVQVARLTLELTEIPRPGQPIRIEKLILDRPALHVATEPGPDGVKAVGLSDLLADSADRPQEDQPADVRLSEVLQIRLLELIDGQVIYEPREPDGAPAGEPMRLDGLNTTLNVQADEQGWYRLAAEIKRPGVFELSADGRLDLDHGQLELKRLALAGRLGRDQDRYLPPQLASLLVEHQVTGALKVAAAGTLPLSDPAGGKLDVDLDVQDAHFVAGDYRGQADELKGKLRLADRQVTSDDLTARTLGGEVTAWLKLGLDEDRRLSLNVFARDIRLEQALRSAAGGQGRPKYRGRVTASVDLAGPVERLASSASGRGTVTLREGDIGRIPVLSDVLAATSQRIGAAIGRAADDRPRDEADLTFTFLGDKVRFTQIDARAPTWAVQGDGDVYFDSRLDLYLNAGPVEKLESLLGPLGKLAGAVTDQIVTYHVTGTTGDAKLRIVPLRKIRKIVP